MATAEKMIGVSLTADMWVAEGAADMDVAGETDVGKGALPALLIS
jgi:hypothetical protein